MSTLRSRSLALRGAALLGALFATLTVLGTWGAAPAEATSYRFWAYWVGADGDWSFSSQGASRRPADGTVDGWRFAVSEASSSTTPPRHTPSFDRICGSTNAVDGSKRVGLVVDFGTTADAPDGETPVALLTTCVVAPGDANGYEVLDLAGVQLRTDSGLICALNGYPATECGAPVADPTSSPSDDPSGGGGGGSGSPPGSADSGGGSPAGGGGVDDPAGTNTVGSTAGNSDGDKNDETGGSTSKRKDDQPQPDTQTKADGPTPEETSLAVSPAGATVSTDGSGSPAGMAVGVAVLAALLVTAYLLRRRRT